MKQIFSGYRISGTRYFGIGLASNLVSGVAQILSKYVFNGYRISGNTCILNINRLEGYVINLIFKIS